MTVYLELDKIVQNSPPELSSYLSSNDCLPSHLSSLLGDYLSQLSGPIGSLDAEILALEEVLRTKKESLERGKAALDAHLRIKAPIRRVPQDVLGVIFPFAVDIPPFNTYANVACLRSVCSLWRHTAMTTPGLSSTLTININKWIGRDLSNQEESKIMLHFKDILSTWTRILRQPYHLNLTSTYGDAPSRERRLLVHQLLSSLPHPNSIYIMSEVAYEAINALPSAYGPVTQVRLADLSGNFRDEPWLKHSFPNLATLIYEGALGLRIKWLQHPNLRSLHLRSIYAAHGSFVRLLQNLPSLRELHLGRIVRDLNAYQSEPSQIDSYPSLEAFTFTGERTLSSLGKCVTFPSLRLLSVTGHEEAISDTLLSEILPRILAKSSPRGLTIALRGKLCTEFVTQIIRHCPPNSHLYLSGLLRSPITVLSDNLDEIFCDIENGDLLWLESAPPRSSSLRPLIIYIPTDIGDQAVAQVESRREELEQCGFSLEMRKWGEIERLILSLAPEMEGKLW
jgi:hypothetical protein